MLTTPAFLALVLLGWAAGWLFLKLWYKRQIDSAEAETKTEQSRVTYWKDRAEEAEKQYVKLNAP